MKFANHAEGYIEPDGAGGYDYVYQYTDHLGNVRLSYSDSNADGAVDNTEIVEESNYYPFGLKHRGYNGAINGMPNKFLTYNGKEFEEALGFNMHEMDMRHYDPAIARWVVQDPVLHYEYSPYQAFDNNPVFWADPSGADSWTNNGASNYYEYHGNVSFGMDETGFSASGKVSGENNTTNNSGNNGGENGDKKCCGESIGNYKHKKSPKESNYYRNHKDQKKIVNKAAYKAGVLATNVSGRLGGDNLGYSGAIRHSYWMYLVAVELGPELAEKLGLLHEDFIITVGANEGKNNLTTRDGKMDVINNAWGIKMAIENPNLDYLEFEELFYEDVKSQNTTIMIFDKKTIPQQTLRETIKYRTKRRNEIKKEMKATEHKRLPSIKF